MKLTTEQLYKNGKMPKWIYNQLNGKSGQENYIETKRQQQEEQHRSKIDEKELEKIVDEKIKQALAEIFSPF